ncbi:MAG: hypothetical protein Q9162_005125 [Coniocarpon cinnabarinum]
MALQLANLPEEVLRTIWNKLSRSDFHAINRTCRWVHRTGYFRRYRHMVVDARKQHPALFLRAIWRKPHLAKHIRSLTFINTAASEACVLPANRDVPYRGMETVDQVDHCLQSLLEQSRRHPSGSILNSTEQNALLQGDETCALRLLISLLPRLEALTLSVDGRDLKRLMRLGDRDAVPQERAGEFGDLFPNLRTVELRREHWQGYSLLCVAVWTLIPSVKIIRASGVTDSGKDPIEGPASLATPPFQSSLEVLDLGYQGVGSYGLLRLLQRLAHLRELQFFNVRSKLWNTNLLTSSLQPSVNHTLETLSIATGPYDYGEVSYKRFMQLKKLSCRFRQRSNSPSALVDLLPRSLEILIAYTVDQGAIAALFANWKERCHLDLPHLKVLECWLIGEFPQALRQEVEATGVKLVLRDPFTD